jgi:hypothetical protein
VRELAPAFKPLITIVTKAGASSRTPRDLRFAI